MKLLCMPVEDMSIRNEWFGRSCSLAFGISGDEGSQNVALSAFCVGEGAVFGCLAPAMTVAVPSILTWLSASPSCVHRSAVEGEGFGLHCYLIGQAVLLP